jgi:hypothetical protein
MPGRVLHTDTNSRGLSACRNVGPEVFLRRCTRPAHPIVIFGAILGGLDRAVRRADLCIDRARSGARLPLLQSLDRCAEHIQGAPCGVQFSSIGSSRTTSSARSAATSGSATLFGPMWSTNWRRETSRKPWRAGESCASSSRPSRPRSRPFAARRTARAGATRRASQQRRRHREPLPVGEDRSHRSHGLAGERGRLSGTVGVARTFGRCVSGPARSRGGAHHRRRMRRHASVAPNDTEANRAKNRRIEFRILER